MENQRPLKNNISSEYTLSYELLFILEWIMDNEYETFKNIIRQAIHQDGYKRIQELSKTDDATIEQEAQSSILDFLALLETAFIEVINENSVNSALERNLLPQINHIDISQCDNNLVATSVAQTTSKIEKNPNVNPQETLFKELLKRWKPKKASKTSIN